MQFVCVERHFEALSHTVNEDTYIEKTKPAKWIEYEVYSISTQFEEGGTSQHTTTTNGMNFVIYIYLWRLLDRHVCIKHTENTKYRVWR